MRSPCNHTSCKILCIVCVVTHGSQTKQWSFRCASDGMTSIKVCTYMFVHSLVCSVHCLQAKIHMQATNFVDAWQWGYWVLVRWFTCMTQFFSIAGLALTKNWSSGETTIQIDSIAPGSHPGCMGTVEPFNHFLHVCTHPQFYGAWAVSAYGHSRGVIQN